MIAFMPSRRGNETPCKLQAGAAFVKGIADFPRRRLRSDWGDSILQSLILSLGET